MKKSLETAIGVTVSADMCGCTIFGCSSGVSSGGSSSVRARERVLSHSWLPTGKGGSSEHEWQRRNWLPGQSEQGRHPGRTTTRSGGFVSGHRHPLKLLNWGLAGISYEIDKQSRWLQPCRDLR